jgi:hypothetical protein
MPTAPRNRDDVAAPPRAGSLRWWISDRQGRTALVAWPNPALVVWLVTVVVRWVDVLDGDRAADVQTIGQGALIVWALDELVRGASPARRVLGALVLGAQCLWFFT